MPTYLKTNTYKTNWIKQLLAENLKPSIVVIQEFQDPEALAQAEIHWIAYFKKMGCQLTNQCRGGEGFTGSHTEESKRKIGAYWKGRDRTKEAGNASRGRFPKRPIQDQHGTVYSSTNEAARKLNLSPGNICSVLKGHYKNTGGYVFRYVD
jgi:hypothetical protein